jgi:peptidoglycan/xylan/chitin deacetylase (PgdA/CDA1 family)
MIERLDGLVGLLGRTLWHLRLHGLVRRLSRNKPKVLLYHACEPEEHPAIRGLGVNCSPSVFAAQLDHLARHYQVVSLAEIESGSARTGAVLITFDDGYRSVMDHAAPLLVAREMTAVVYLVTDVVGNDDVVWVNELNWLLVNRPAEVGPLATAELGLPSRATSSEVLSAAVCNYDPVTVERLLENAWAEVGERSSMIDDLDLYLGWDEIRQMERAGFAFGSHTATHPDLTRVPAEDLHREVERSVETITRELGGCSSFAFPFGFTDPEVTAMVEGFGFDSVMLAGSVHPSDPPRRLSRVSLTSASDAQIFAELEVIGPTKRLIRSLLRRIGLPRPHAA